MVIRLKHTFCEINDMNQDADMVGKSGAGRLRWGLDEWFGAILGGTSWFFFCAVVFVWKGQFFEATVSAISWMLVIALACWLWSYRDQVAPFHAFACVMLLLSLMMPIVWFICWDVPTDQRMPSLYWIRGARSAAACLIAPVILLCFFIREHFGSHERNPYVDEKQTGG